MKRYILALTFAACTQTTETEKELAITRDIHDEIGLIGTLTFTSCNELKFNYQVKWLGQALHFTSEIHAGGKFQIDFQGKKIVDGDLPSPTCQTDTPSLTQVIQSHIEMIVSDCQIKRTAQSWTCETALHSVEPAYFSAMVKSMTRGWQTQPYILARRATSTRSLAEATQYIQQNKDYTPLDRFCRMMKLSHAEELPLVLTVPEVQKNVCEPGPDRAELAFYSLTMAQKEVHLLKSLYDRTHRSGVFSLKTLGKALLQPISEDEELMSTKKSSQWLVTITPGPEVMSHLRDELHFSLSQTTPTGSQNHCFHPLFTEDKFAVASGLGLIGCKTNSPDAAVSYILASVTSETSFILENGMSKALTLPSGQYSYAVYPFKPVHVNTAVSTGDLPWFQRKTGKIVRK